MDKKEVERKINCVQHLVITGKVIARAASSSFGATYSPNSSVPPTFLLSVRLTLVIGVPRVARVPDKSFPFAW